MNSLLFSTIIPAMFSIVFITVFISIFISAITTIKRTRQITGKSSFNFPKINDNKYEGIHNDSFSHQKMHDYSQSYSVNNTVKDSGIKDKPLSEAEKNVLYGK